MSPSTEAVERNVLIVSSFVTGLMMIEYLWSIRFEVNIIWPRIRKNAEAKIYVLSRYVGLAGQVFNVWFARRMASGIPTHPRACMVWYSYQAATIQCLLTLVELLLMMRVYNIYKKGRYVLGILGIFVGTQCAAMVVSTRMVVPGQRTSPTCILVATHPGPIYVGVSTIVINWCVLAMILRRCARVAWLEPGSYFRVMVRDSTCTVIVMTGCFVFVILMAIGVLDSLTVHNVLFYLMLSSLWFSAGRLVLSKEKFRQEHKDDADITLVDLDDLEPSDFDACLAGPYDSKVVPIEVSITVNPESDVGLEGDITDEPLCHWADRGSLSSCASTILRTEMSRDEEGSGSSTNSK